MTLEVVIWKKHQDFKLFGVDIIDLRVYHNYPSKSYKYRVMCKSKSVPLISDGSKLGTIEIPYENKVLSFRSCYIRNTQEYQNIYKLVFIAEDLSIHDVIEFSFKDGQQIIHKNDLELVKLKYDNIKQLTYEEFKTRLFTCKL